MSKVELSQEELRSEELCKEEILELFKKLQALKEGHFLLTSGRHSDRYLQCALVLQYPAVAEKLCRQLLQKIAIQDIDLVIGPAIGGITLAYEIGRQLGAIALFAEREDKGMSLRRGFSIPQGAKVLVVEDVITTGGSVKETIQVVKAHSGVVIGIACLVDRSGGKVDLGYPLYSLLSLEVVSYEAAACPLCQKGLPIVKPGSRKRQ